MTHKERFFATLDRRPVDRPASWLGLPTSEAVPALLAYFQGPDITALKRRLDDDVFPVDVPYNDPPANHIACALNFASPGTDYEERTLTAPGFFAECADPARVRDFPWPDPARHIDPAACAAAVNAAPDDYAVMGILWSAHFQDACAAFGMENAMMAMITEPATFQAVIDRIVEFYLAANDIFYRATRGKLDAVLIGNDFGSQNALMVSADHLRRFVFPGTRKLVEQAHAFGLRVIHHSCGAISPVIDDLRRLGVDAIHPIQALAAGMDAGQLAAAFAGNTSFCGGVDAQNLLVNGTPEAIRRRVLELKRLFPTGLVISPSHEAILADIPPRNVEALFAAVSGK